jgi:flagellar capping protein FliD
MGIIEEGRQLIQDFVTPEIRSIDTRLTVVEKKLESLEAKNDKRFDALDVKVDRVQTALEGKVDRVQTALEGKVDRVQTALEKKVGQVQTAFESRIDKSNARTEKELGTLQSRLEALDAKFDKNQAQIMDSLHQWGNIAQILERLAKVESKLQNVA